MHPLTPRATALTVDAAGHPFVAPTGGPSFELAAAYLAVALALLLVGPGSLSLDYCFFGRRRSDEPFSCAGSGRLQLLVILHGQGRLAGEPADILIQPRLGGMGIFDFHRAAPAIEEGRAAVEHMLPAIRARLALE